LTYGIPLSATMAGVMMDVDRLAHQVRDKANSATATAQYLLSQGARQSLNENQIPEQMLSTEAQTVEGVSAAKALSLASQQGQRIYTVTQANAATVLPQLSHGSAVMADIASAVNAGKVVTVSQSPVTHAGWTGTGYVVADVQTGAVAYLIGGGVDGAILLYYFIGVALTIASAALVVGATVAIFQFSPIIAALVGSFGLWGVYDSFKGLVDLVNELPFTDCTPEQQVALVKSYVGLMLLTTLVSMMTLDLGVSGPVAVKEAELLFRLIGVDITIFGFDKFASAITVNCTND
jgi:hypothetical protein